MVMRISENMKFNTIVNNMFKSQDSYNKLAEKIASQKAINRPSDDPIGMNKILNLRESRTSIEQYTRNMDGSESWLTITESKLSAAGDLLVDARVVAIAQSTVTSSAETLSSQAETVQQIMDQMLVLANSKYGDRYLFSGTKTEEAPFSSSVRSATIGTAAVGDGNGDFNGTVTSGGVYSGSVNKTYVVKIVTDGEALAATKYQVSVDGGKTWSDPPSTGLVDGVPITLGDEGVQLTFTEGPTKNLSENDIFYVQALAAGYYNGNGEEMSVNIDERTSFAYSISGEAAFTDKGKGIFDVLNRLKTALENNEPDEIALCIDDLKAGSDQISKNISSCGSRMNRLEIAKSNLADLDFNLTKFISDTEDADMAEIITRFTMKETALKASYATASKIGNLTILDFLR